MSIPKITIGGKRIKCTFCGRTAKVMTKFGHPICGHCFKAFAFGLLLARFIGPERTMEEKLTIARKNTLYGKVKGGLL